MLDTKVNNDSSIQVIPEPIQLLSTFERQILENKLNTESRPEYRQRIEIMLLTDLGQSQSAICAALNCSKVTVRYWMLMAKTGQALQWKDIPIGRPKTVNEQYIKRLKELVNHSPQESGYSFRRWTAQWLSKHLAQELGIEISDRHINRLLKKMGVSSQFKRSAKEAKNNLTSTEGSSLVIGELNSDAKPNFSCLGSFESNYPIV